MHPLDNDPIVAEVRRIREEYAAKFGYDIKLMNEDTKRRARVLRALFAPHDPADENANLNELTEDDPNIGEVRRILEEYAAKFGYDMKLKRRARELRARFAAHDRAMVALEGS
jgi:hypothetical protein